jgi:hypothetical protein
VGLIVRQFAEAAKFVEEIGVEALDGSISPATVDAVLADLGACEQRCRKLPARVVVWLSLAMHLFAEQALADVLASLVGGLRLWWPTEDVVLAGRSAICQARARLGPRPLVALFHRVCQPLATPTTPGAFLFGLRLVALDGTLEAVPDSPANAQAFGYPHNQHGGGAFPQVQAVYLAECGTHAILDAGFWPCQTSERVGGRRLLRSVGPDMLVLWDKGFHSYAMVAATRQRGAHILGRVSTGVRLPVEQRLADGSYLTTLYPGSDWRRRGAGRLPVRVLCYTLTDPARPGFGERHRLLTSLLDPHAAPTLDLICAYHERWEVELTIDELDTHQRLAIQPLRSQRPAGVIQELYALLVVHFAIRRVMVDAAQAADLDPDRLSFVHTVRLLRLALHDFQAVAPASWPILYARLLGEVARQPLPPRANRSNPRVVKQRVAKFPVKRPRHRRWPQPATAFREAVAILI